MDPATASEQYFEELINGLKLLGYKIIRLNVSAFY